MKKDQKVIIGIGLFFVVPLAVSIALIIYSNIAKENTLKSALETTVDNDIASVISKQNNINLDSYTLHEIAKSGDYVAVGAFSTKASNFGDGATIVLKKERDKYETIYAGTGYSYEDLVELGVPTNFAKQLVSKSKNGYLEALSSSNLNPRNKYSLVQKLPITTDDLSISYYFIDNLKDDDGVNIPVITISGTDAAERKTALNKIRSLGYDLGYYPVVFNNFRNPFPVVNTDWGNIIKEDSEDNSERNSEAIINYDDEEGP